MTSSPVTNASVITIVGGGITGLAAAWELKQRLPQIALSVIESQDRVGGVLQTVQRDGLLFERSADSFLTSEPQALELAQAIGLGNELISVQPGARRALILRGNRLFPVPAGLQVLAPAQLSSLLTTPLLSWAGRLRMCLEPWVTRKADSTDETLASFAIRRLGSEAYERIVQPLAGGIWTADPHKLSMQAALPRFVDMEREFGGLYWGLRAKRNRVADAATIQGARYSQFASLRGGIEQLTRCLATKLSAAGVELLTSCAVQKLARQTDGNWQLHLSNGEVRASHGLILTVPAGAATRLLTDTAPRLSALLSEIEYAGSAIIVAAYPRAEIQHPLQASGFVVPAAEQRRILACSFSSEKFAERVPPETVLLRTFVGGALQKNLLERNDQDLAALAHQELTPILGLQRHPLWSEVARWDRAMPQYHVGHIERIQAIDQCTQELPGLAVAGAAYRGVGIPACIRDAYRAVEKIVADGSLSRSPQASYT